MKVQPKLYNIKIKSQSDWETKTIESLLNQQEKFKPFEFLILAEIPDDMERFNYHQLLDNENVVVSDEQMIELILAKISFDVIHEVKVDIDISREIMELAEKPITITSESGNNNVYNNKCEVHMPGQALSVYNECLLLGDACTDALQSSLNSGWRIIAACPQPDQRRPDYILGRFNPELDEHGSARRNP